MIGCIGDDGFGKEMRVALESEGIDTTHVLVHPEAATGVALIQVDAQGQNSIAVASGANFRLSGSDVDKAMQAIGKFDALVMPLETRLETVSLRKLPSVRGQSSYQLRAPRFRQRGPRAGRCAPYSMNTSSPRRPARRCICCRCKPGCSGSSFNSGLKR